MTGHSIPLALLQANSIMFQKLSVWKKRPRMDKRAEIKNAVAIARLALVLQQEHQSQGRRESQVECTSHFSRTKSLG